MLLMFDLTCIMVFGYGEEGISSLRGLQVGFCIAAVNRGCVSFLSNAFTLRVLNTKLTWLTKKVTLQDLRTESYITCHVELC